jgi:hypothetical protein
VRYGLTDDEWTAIKAKPECRRIAKLTGKTYSPIRSTLKPAYRCSKGARLCISDYHLTVSPGRWAHDLQLWRVFGFR